MNLDDARRFVALIDAGGDLTKLEQAARTAALTDRLPAGVEGTTGLQGSLRDENQGSGTLIFNDSMAPQFLISCIILAETPIAGGVSYALIREDKNAFAI
jgi:hypothetical protein